MHKLLPTLPLLYALAAPAADPLQDHLAAAAAALQAEARGDHAATLAACQVVIDLLPDGPRSPRCRARVRRLLERRDPDGTWTSLRAWEDAKRLSDDPDAARAAVTTLLTAEPLPAALRAEATAWLAADDLHRRDDPAACLDHTEALYARREALDEVVRTDLVTLRAQALARLGRAEEARAALDEVRVATPAPRPTVVDQELALQARARWRRVSWGTLGLFLLLALPRLPRVRPPGPPWGLAPLLVVSAGAWALAELWEAGQGRAALPLAGALTAIHLVAWRAAAGRGRWGIVISCAAILACLAGAWLVLDHMDVMLL